MTVFRMGPTAPDDAIRAALQRRAVLPGEFYGRLRREARAAAFTVSRLTQIEHIEYVQRLLIEDLRDGGNFARWKQRMLEHPEIARLQSWHLETIYRTNAMAHYAHGRARSILEHASTHPFLMYSAVLDTRVRPTHAKLHGIILPVDHPFWKLHFPPLGFNCRCQVISLTRAQAERRIAEARDRGRNVTEPPPGVWADEGWDYDRLHGSTLSGLRSAIARRASALTDQRALSIVRAIDDHESLMQAAIARESAWVTERRAERRGLVAAMVAADGTTTHRMLGRGAVVALKDEQTVDLARSVFVLAQMTERAPALSAFAPLIRESVREAIMIAPSGARFVIRSVRGVSSSSLAAAYRRAENEAQSALSAAIQNGKIRRADADLWIRHIVLLMMAAGRWIEYETARVSIPDSLNAIAAQLVTRSL